VTSSGTAQGIRRQRAGAAVDEQEVGIWAWRPEDQALASGPVLRALYHFFALATITASHLHKTQAFVRNLPRTALG
jgi:hypothetical protein